MSPSVAGIVPLGIGNACDVPLSGLSAVPRVGAAIMNWFKPLNLVRIRQQTVDFKTVEVEVPVSTFGVIQPFSEKQLEILPEGQRAWRWSMVHSTPDLVLEPGEIIAFGQQKHRVMGQNDYTDEGFVQYRVVNDYDIRAGGRVST